MTTITVHSSAKDHSLLKAKLVAALAGAELVINSSTQDQLTALESDAKSILLETTSGFISQHLAVLRYIALSTENSLSGSDELEKDQINQWLDFSSQDLGENLLTFI
jgi:hypothetical protein